MDPVMLCARTPEAMSSSIKQRNNAVRKNNGPPVWKQWRILVILRVLGRIAAAAGKRDRALRCIETTSLGCQRHTENHADCDKPHEESIGCPAVILLGIRWPSSSFRATLGLKSGLCGRLFGTGYLSHKLVNRLLTVTSELITVLKQVSFY
jgi:hypothetical protein